MFKAIRNLLFKNKKPEFVLVPNNKYEKIWFTKEQIFAHTHGFARGKSKTRV